MSQGQRPRTSFDTKTTSLRISQMNKHRARAQTTSQTRDAKRGADEGTHTATFQDRRSQMDRATLTYEPPYTGTTCWAGRRSQLQHFGAQKEQKMYICATSISQSPQTSPSQTKENCYGRRQREAYAQNYAMADALITAPMQQHR